MGEKSRDMDENVTPARRFWGLRPWKRHSTILLVAGILYILIGLSFTFGQSNTIRDAALVVVLQIAPISFWGWVFVAAGIAVMISSRWPPLYEVWGYMLLTGLSSMWGATYLTGFLFYHARMSLSGVIVWGLLAFLWWGVSGLLNPDKTAVMTRGRS